MVPSLTRYPLVVFDFDGTLADTFSWFTSVFDEVADKYGFDRLDRGKLEELRRLDAREIMARHRVALWKLPAIAQHMRKLMERDIDRIALFPGIDAALRQLSDQGRTLALVTSNSKPNVLRVLGPQVAARFHHFECGISLFGKLDKLRKVLAARRLPPHEAILIGDEIRDAEAAAQAGVAFGAVAWGYTHVDALVASSTKEVFASPQELSAKLP